MENVFKLLPMLRFLIAITTLMFIGTTYGADYKMHLLSTAPADLLPVSLRPAISAPWQNQSRDTVSVSYPLNMDSALQPNPQPEAKDSREYWRRVRGPDFNKGVHLPTTVPGALLRISPLTLHAVTIDADTMTVAIADGAPQTLTSAARSLIKSSADEQTLALPAGGLALRLRDSVGAGDMLLQSSGQFGDNDEFLIQVYEPDSPIHLQARQSDFTVFAGGHLEANATLLHDNAEQQLTTATATLIAPDGRRQPLLVSIRHGRQIIVHQLVDVPASDKPGLWEIEWYASSRENGLQIERQTRTAFGLANACARWVDDVKWSNNTGSEQLQLSLPIAALSAGRYELRAIIAVRSKQGVSRPIAQLSSASWLEPGQAQLSLKLNRKILYDANAEGELVVQQLQLIDQSRMAILQTQATALVLPQSIWQTPRSLEP